MLDLLLDCLFPRRSLTGEEGAWVTAAELRSLAGRVRLLDAAALRRRGVALDALAAAGAYADPLLARAVRAWKYGRIPGLGPPLQSLLAEASLLLPAGEGTVLCPVPLHWTRLFWRGFNQSERLADGLAARRGWPVRELLRRARSTGWQASRTAAERRAAMDGAFAVAVPSVPPHVTLIDDVATTCSTLDACARALRTAGVSQVDAVVLALA